MRMIHALSVQLRQVLSWKLLSCILVFAGVQGLAISGLIARETKHYVYEDNLDEVADDPIPVMKTK